MRTAWVGAGLLWLRLGAAPAVGAETAPWAQTGIALQSAPSQPELRLHPLRLGSFELSLVAGLWLYQQTLGRADGASCNFYPTCSGYAKLAVQKHGALMGAVMAAERVMRSHRRSGRYEVRAVHGVPRLWDPVEHNDGWWDRESE